MAKGFIATRIRTLIYEELYKNAEKIDHWVDCIVRDIRNGKSRGKETKKAIKFITDVAKAVAIITAAIKTAKAIQKTLEASRKAAEASKKASTIASALNPGTAAVAVAGELIIAQIKIEEEDLKDAINYTEPAMEVFNDTLGYNKERLKSAAAEKIASDLIEEETKNMLN